MATLMKDNMLQCPIFYFINKSILPTIQQTITFVSYPTNKYTTHKTLLKSHYAAQNKQVSYNRRQITCNSCFSQFQYGMYNVFVECLFFDIDLKKKILSFTYCGVNTNSTMIILLQCSRLAVFYHVDKNKYHVLIWNCFRTVESIILLGTNFNGSSESGILTNKDSSYTSS